MFQNRRLNARDQVDSSSAILPNTPLRKHRVTRKGSPNFAFRESFTCLCDRFSRIGSGRIALLPSLLVAGESSKLIALSAILFFLTFLLNI